MPFRDALAWSKYINEALYRFGDEAEVMFASHSWPRWGKQRIQDVMCDQRDMYANLNNQVMHLANSGVTISQIHISSEDSAPLYAEMMGGATKILAKAKELNDQGKYRYSVEILNKLVYAEPQNEAAKDLLADSYEQLGCQCESPSLRNNFLSGAKELRDGIIPVKAAKAGSPDFVRGTSTELFLDYLAIQMDSRKAEVLNFKVNLSTPDNAEKFVVEMSNATLTTISGYQAKNADLTITINRSDLEDGMIGKAKLAEKVASGKATMEGNSQVLARLASTMDQWDPWFEVVPGTKQKLVEKLKTEVFFDDDPFVIRPEN